MCGVLLGCSLEPRPDSRALASAGLVMTMHRFINKQMLAFEKTSMTRENKIC